MEHSDYLSRTVSIQKNNWFNKRNILLPRNFCPGGRFKAEYATPYSILIDDHIPNILKFREAGGIGIHHTGVDATIEMLYDSYELLKGQS